MDIDYSNKGNGAENYQCQFSMYLEFEIYFSIRKLDFVGGQTTAWRKKKLDSKKKGVLLRVISKLSGAKFIKNSLKRDRCVIRKTKKVAKMLAYLCMYGKWVLLPKNTPWGKGKAFHSPCIKWERRRKDTNSFAENKKLHKITFYLIGSVCLFYCHCMTENSFPL